MRQSALQAGAMPFPARDIDDRKLVRLTAAAVGATAAWFALRPWLAPAWREPGSPELYLSGLAGALLLLVPAAFALAKRGGRAATRAAGSTRTSTARSPARC